MSDDAIVGLLVGLALMFLGPIVTLLLVGRRSQIVSSIIALGLLACAWQWPTLKTHIAGTALHDSLASAASNAYVWLGMLAVTWLYLSVGNLVAPRGVPQKQRREARPLPESLSRDRERLIKRLSGQGYKAQILYGATEKAARIAKELDEIMTAAGWQQPSPPTQVAPAAKIGRGVTIRSSFSDSGSDSLTRLANALNEVGIDSDDQRTADLREYDYCFVYVVE